MLRVRDLFAGLLPRLPGGHEDHFVQVEHECDLGGCHKVPVVDGVEGAAHHAQPGLARLARWNVQLSALCDG